MRTNKILVVGGAGYIGSHMTRLLFDHGHDVTVFDNDYSVYKGRLPKIKQIKGDLRNFKDINQALKKDRYDLLMYFAGYIIAPESAVDPVKYYENNVAGAVNLLKAVHENKLSKLIFSSTAAVYGNPKKVPIVEDAPLFPVNPYGHTKLMFEQMLKDLSAADAKFRFIALRYFNAAGAHESGLMGEAHRPETHLIPNVLKTVKGELKQLLVYGDDYPTKDGTCIRDYIHVQDLCEAHYLAIKALDRGIKNEIFNLGTGRGYSVKEIIKEAERITGKSVNVKMAKRRPGDPAVLVASFAKAKKILGWTPKRRLKQIIESAWRWESRR